MSVDAYLQIGERSVMSYLIKPLANRIAKAWREKWGRPGPAPVATGRLRLSASAVTTTAVVAIKAFRHAGPVIVPLDHGRR